MPKQPPSKIFHALDPLIHPLPDLLHKDSDFVNRLFDLVDSSISPPFSLSLNGTWGSGKTTLMKALEEKFEESKQSKGKSKKGYPVFWFNPWEYERVEDLVFCFLVELTRFAKKHLGDLTKLAKEIGIFATTFFAVSTDLVARLCTKNALSMENIGKVRAEIEESLKGRYQGKSAVEIVKADFVKLTKKISKEHDELPLIVFLDDLDRCLPDKALGLLESLKNLFVVKGAQVIFISGIDTGVAKQFIVKRYEGLDQDFAHNYFKKIFNLTLNIPLLTEKSFSTLLTKQTQNIVGSDKDSWKFLQDAEKKEEIVSTLSQWLIQAEARSIRQAYSILHNFFITIHFQSGLKEGSEPEKKFDSQKEYKVVLFLCTAKECWPDAFSQLQILAKKEPPEDLASLADMLVKEEKASQIWGNLWKKFNELPLGQRFLGENLLEFPL